MALCTKLAAFALVGMVRGMNLVNPATHKCLDLYAPCKGGEEEKGCERVAPGDLKKGTNLQMYACHNKANQQFELLDNGRIRNPLTGLCIDVQAPCVEGEKEPKCNRVAVGDIKKEANVQLWTCHEDQGTLSNSYGNQKWHIRSDGRFKNEGANLCLDALRVEKDDGRIDSSEVGDMANVQVYSCHTEGEDASDGNQKFDLETGDVAEENEDERLFQVIPDGDFLQSKRPAESQVKLVLPAVGICGLVVAGFVGMRARRSADQAPSE